MNQFGLNDNQLKFIERIFRKHLGEKQFRIWIFGSRATGKYQKYSDVDLLIECSDLSSVLISRIRGDFEESNFPYKTDVVNANDLAPDYEQGIEEDKKLLFENV
jgi:predicted nucleotidyltransferase